MVAEMDSVRALFSMVMVLCLDGMGVRMRIDKDGRDVTDLPGLWDESDCEIVATNFSHPTVTTGQHTNGKATIWIRLADKDWMLSHETSLHKARSAWVEMGIEWFIALNAEFAV
jgi:hypothetical protein